MKLYIWSPDTDTAMIYCVGVDVFLGIGESVEQVVENIQQQHFKDLAAMFEGDPDPDRASLPERRAKELRERLLNAKYETFDLTDGFVRIIECPI